MHTVSSIKEWRSCRRRYRYKYVDLIRPVKISKALSIGTAFHAGLEAVWSGDLDGALARAETALADAWWQTPEGLVERARVRAMLSAYVARWRDSQADWQPVEVEGVFNLDLVPGSTFAGKRDALARHIPTGQLYLVEHKTASEDIADVGADYWQRLALDLQLTVYQEAVATKLGEVPAILYDVARKPGGSPKLKKSIARRKDESDESLAARKDAERETVDEFEARLLADITATPDDYLVRREVHRTREQNAEQLAELRETIAELDSYRGSYPRHDAECRSRFGVCPYLGVCAGVETLDSERFYRLDVTHPELQAEHEADEYADCPL